MLAVQFDARKLKRVASALGISEKVALERAIATGLRQIAMKKNPARRASKDAPPTPAQCREMMRKAGPVKITAKMRKMGLDEAFFS